VGDGAREWRHATLHPSPVSSSPGGAGLSCGRTLGATRRAYPSSVVPRTLAPWGSRDDTEPRAVLSSVRGSLCGDGCMLLEALGTGTEVARCTFREGRRATRPRGFQSKLPRGRPLSQLAERWGGLPTPRAHLSPASRPCPRRRGARPVSGHSRMSPAGAVGVSCIEGFAGADPVYGLTHEQRR
jgi:hypothetical protein